MIKTEWRSGKLFFFIINIENYQNLVLFMQRINFKPWSSSNTEVVWCWYKPMLDISLHENSLLSCKPVNNFLGEEVKRSNFSLKQICKENKLEDLWQDSIHLLESPKAKLAQNFFCWLSFYTNVLEKGTHKFRTCTFTK